MTRKAQIGTGRNVIYRIAALLFALADLAERAAGAPRPVRCVVLWALWQADAVAREFVAQAGYLAGPPSSPDVMSVHCGCEPADAMNLATSLRMLALIVQAMAMSDFGSAFHEAGHLGLTRLSAYRSFQNLSREAATAAHCDTS